MTETHINCLECGKHIVKPRKNQKFCSAICRTKTSHRGKFSNAAKPTRACPECGDTFDLTRATKRFCSTSCQQAFNNFWKSKGAKIALAMFDWRVDRKPKAMSIVCQEFSHARAEQKERRKAKQKTE